MDVRNQTWLLAWMSILLSCLLQTTTGQSHMGLFEATIEVVSEGTRFMNRNPRDAEPLRRKYDFIIVGAGTAGCLLANRLSADPTHTVLLIEAGRDESFIMDVPILANFFQLTPETNWGHKTMKQDTACLGLKNKQCKLPRGKVLGGSSVLNYMIYTRGNKIDYDRWRDMGNPGWGYDDIMPYFRRLEDVQIYRNFSIRGTAGPLTITHPPWHTPLAESFLEAGKEMGYDIVDYNGERQLGFQFIEATMRNGTRLSSNRAFLMPVRDRPNLHVKKFAMVSRVIIDPKSMRAIGVEFIKEGKAQKVLADKEVILSAGALGTPPILMQSGIGPADHLRSMGIPVLQDLKVGYNLQDHLSVPALTFLIDKKVSIINERILDDAKMIIEFMAYHQGPITVPGGVEAISFMNSKYSNNTEYPDIELLFAAGSMTSDPTLHACLGLQQGIYNEVYKPIERKDGFTIFPLIMRPKSQGRVMLRSRDPMKLPLIQHNYLMDDSDIEILLEGVKTAIKVAESEPFKQYNTRLHNIPIPACKRFAFNSDDYWRCTIRQLTMTFYHQCGTAKMGPATDPDAVVDPELRVYGVKGLRVVDASIMPFVPTAHTNGPVYMIAEKASDMIRNTWRTRM
ncbi:glucose dehydrogenase [FAD, quinone]-like [Cloeon dipterum]|uniref:glucose dehydrogenase [FAD, quinone]-like n=1 Tax=Cloeon dipterum TaxID=197152 RepID=UPI00321F8B3A